ncbi:MAG: hypothetical protein H7A25_21670 [Leptospiraceae bacterium]|nr:hypothetical protein [Leptospiraceae bacterium]
MKKTLLVFPLLFLFSCALFESFEVNVNNLKLLNINPDYKKPLNTNFTVAYDILANSPFIPNMSLPVDKMGLNIFVEDVKAFDSKLPEGVNSLSIGKPVTLESKIVINDVKELASKIPSLVLKDQWLYAVKGDLQVKGRNFPIETKKSMDSPLKGGLDLKNLDKLKSLF